MMENHSLLLQDRRVLAAIISLALLKIIQEVSGLEPMVQVYVAMMGMHLPCFQQPRGLLIIL